MSASRVFLSVLIPLRFVDRTGRLYFPIQQRYRASLTFSLAPSRVQERLNVTPPS